VSGTLVAALGLTLLFVLLLIRVPIGLALLIVGAAGIAAINPAAVVPAVGGEVFGVASNPSLVILPMFILMGNLAAVSGMSRDLYRAANAWLGMFKGGLASASVVACAWFSALSGSSLASALTMARVALPEMRRYRYDDALATGVVAAGGTLGILIPPSAGFILYGILTEQSIGRLFAAGVVPGILLVLLFILTIWLVVRLDPRKAPDGGHRGSWKERFLALRRAGWITGIIVVTIGGIYAGILSAVEAAGVGAFLACAVAAGRRALTRKAASDVVKATLSATGTAFLILSGAFVFKVFMGHTETLFVVSDWIDSRNFSALQVVAVVLAFSVLLGTFLDGFAILVLMVPLCQPILESLGVDMIWFGVLIVITLEMGLISPPVGLNVFVVQSVARDVPLATVFRGIWPFWLAMLSAVLLIALFPQIATLLPAAVYE